MTEPTTAPKMSFIDKLNGPWHERALWVYLAIVLVHWVEHLFQAAQIWILGMPRPQALGALGYVFPWLVKSEVMHFTYAVLMFVGLVLLRQGFHGTARAWWTASLVIQTWHLFEHTLLLIQATVGQNLFGSPVPTSILQQYIPRPESTCSTTSRSSSRWSSRCGCTPVRIRPRRTSAPAPCSGPDGAGGSTGA